MNYGEILLLIELKKIIKISLLEKFFNLKKLVFIGTQILQINIIKTLTIKIIKKTKLHKC